MGVKPPTPERACCKVSCLKGPSPFSLQKTLCLAPMPGKNGLQDQEKVCKHKEHADEESSDSEEAQKCPVCGKKLIEKSSRECCKKNKAEQDNEKKNCKDKNAPEEVCAEYVPTLRCKIFVRPKSRELRGGVHYTHCDCGKLNGLQHDCRRSECQGCPECIVYPPICINSPYTNAKHLSEIEEANLRKMRCP